MSTYERTFRGQLMLRMQEEILAAWERALPEHSLLTVFATSDGDLGVRISSQSMVMPSAALRTVAGHLLDMADEIDDTGSITPRGRVTLPPPEDPSREDITETGSQR